jgi:predicted nuclease of restriction endonuclease-like RecB superfamily
VKALDDRDLPWIGESIDIVARAEGQPWRVAETELERVLAPAGALAAVTSSLRKLLGGRAAHARVAREVRAMVLGAPALSAGARDARLDACARSLGLAAHELEALLWSDLPRERAVELPAGRPSELDVAAHANVQLVQRALGRAHGVQARLWGDAGVILRGALARGLIVTATREADHIALAIVGPLALCHRTGVYGRALAQLAPLLAACDRFELAIDAGDYTTAIASPMLLPPAPVDRASGYLARKLARDLGRLDRSLDIALAPEPLAAGRELVCPDLVVGDTCIELVGFWTAEYLAAKLARYRHAHARVLLVVDQARGADDLPSGSIGYTRRIDAASVLTSLRCRSPDG